MAELPRPFGSYLLLKSLGTGGTGDVYLARPESRKAGIPSPVVIKRLHAQLASRDEFVKRFQHEAEIAVAINSPHLPKVFDVGRVDDTFYIAMEYLAGWTVGRVMKDLTTAGGSASISSIADVIRGGLLGLDALHQAKHPRTGEPLGIVHRDIAPKNLMIGEDGVTRLIDLGLGKSSIQDWRTGTGIVMGSPGYMAPEQALAGNVDQRCDLYAIGIVLWEFLTLERYIKRAPVPIMLRSQVRPTYVPPSQHRRDVPPSLDAICEKALAIDPEHRFQSAREFVAALDEAVPPREDEEPLATIVGEMLWGELGQAKTEVTKLLSITPAKSAPPKLAETETLEVYAERAEPTPMAFSTPLVNATYMPPPPSGVPVRAVLLLMGLTLLIGFGIGALFLHERAPVAATVPQQTIPEPVTVETPVPAAEPVVVAEPTPVVEPPPPAPPPPPVKRTVKVREESEPAPPPKKIDAPRSDRERLLDLMKKARALRSQLAGTSAERDLKALLGKAAQEASASEINTRALEDLEAELRRLEAARP